MLHAWTMQSQSFEINTASHLGHHPASLPACPRTINPRLGLMTSLRSLPLDGNPTKIVRRELLAGPISALLEHLRTKLSEEELEVDNHR